MRRAAAALCLLAACSFHDKQASRQSVTHLAGALALDDDATVRAAGVTTAGGSESFRATADFQYRRPSRHDRPGAGPAWGGTLDLGLQASLFGILSTDRRFDHWLDLGVHGAVGGGGAPGEDLLGLLRAGGWIEVGLAPGRTHPVLRLSLERAWTSDPWENQTLFTIGLGRRTRGPLHQADWAAAMAR